jgi:hypothetical protein|tara:strand:- start:576 stop:1034 length:459 start_codon:yes stop_codon:yes gene_type:complete
MTEENNSQTNTGDKNWKEIREQNEFLKGKVAEYEAKERTQVFKLAGLDPTKGVGKAVDMMFEGELNVDNIKQYATEEFGVEFGQQDGLQQDVGLQQQVEASQDRLNNIQQNSVVDNYNTDAVAQLDEIVNKGTVKQSIAAKLYAQEEAKKNN